MTIGVMDAQVYEVMAQVEDWFWWNRGLRSLVHRSLRRCMMGDHRRLRILDAGCGTGGELRALNREFPGHDVVGLDLADQAVASSAQRSGGLIVQGSVSRLPFHDGAFDIVLLLDVLYIEGLDEAQVLNEAHRVLSEGGELVLNVCAFEALRGSHDLAVHTRRRYRREEVRGLLMAANFRIERLNYWNTLLFPAVFFIRKFSKGQKNRPKALCDLRPIAPALNKCLTKLIVIDTWLSSVCAMPFGTSVFSVASKMMTRDK